MKDKMRLVSTVIISLILFALILILVTTVYGEDTIYERKDENGVIHIFESKGDSGLFFFDGNLTNVDDGYVLNGTLYQEQQLKDTDEEEDNTVIIILVVVMIVLVGISLACIMKGQSENYEDSIMCCEEVIKRCEREEE